MDRGRPIELEAGWKYMAEGITKLKRILEGEKGENFTAEHYMMLYTTIYNMCTQKPPHDHSEALYARYREAFSQYISEAVLPALRGLRGEPLLRALVARWDNHRVMVRWLSRFFNYLDRYYIQRHNLHSLADVGMLAFRDGVYAEAKRPARDAVLALMEAEREGDAVDRALLRSVLDIFTAVGMGSMDAYEADFEAAALAAAAEYYRVRAAAWVAADSTPEYLVKAEAALRAEEERVQAYLHASTKPKLLQAAEEALLAEHAAALLEKEGSGAAALLRDDKADDLARMHRLFGRVPRGLEPLADAFRRHVEAEGLAAVREAGEAADARAAGKAAAAAAGGAGAGGAAPAAAAAAAAAGGSAEQSLIRALIALHDKYSEYVSGAFSNSSLFHKALKEAFECACNKQVGAASVAELMAGFCDAALRKGGAAGGERLGDEELDALLDKGVRLLAYVSDKDLFSEFYRKRLSSRLLRGLSASEDAEKAVLSRLKAQCGQQFTSKMEGMVQDLQLAKEKEHAFADWLARHGRRLPIDMSVQVLTTGFWPSYKSLEMALPGEMMEALEAFTAFHEEAHKKTRRLQWQLTVGTVHVKAAYDKAYELVLQPVQAAVLVPLADEARLSYAELKERTRLPDDDLARALASLTLAKHKLLVKTPPGRAIGRDDVFAPNPAFSDRQRRIRVPLPPVDDRARVREDVDRDRKHAIEAAVVRVMKSRKAAAHAQLVMEVHAQLARTFDAQPRDIKRAIESLIEREYLQRDAAAASTYRYLA